MFQSFQIRYFLLTFVCVIYTAWIGSSPAQELTVEVDRLSLMHQVSRFLTGACIEDVNHEIYGGIYSQMIFGESFQEPAFSSSVDGFAAYGGDWQAVDGVVQSSTANGNKLVSNDVYPADSDVSVDVWFENNGGGNAGLIVRTSQAGVGLDRFHGYEVALDPARQIVRLGRHQNNFVLLRDVACKVGVQEWIKLEVITTGATIEIMVDGKSQMKFTDSSPILGNGQIGLRHFHNQARYRNLTVKTTEATKAIPLTARSTDSMAVSRMWQPCQSGEAKGNYRQVEQDPFVGKRCQVVDFEAGAGSWGIFNKGLNGWGLSFEKGRLYEGEIYVKAEKPCDFTMSAESGDGSVVLAEHPLRATSKQWTKLSFTLIPNGTVNDGRIAIKLTQPGSIAFGYAFLQPGEWGRFKRLPLRRDVVEGLLQQGITVLRYGGSMVDNPPDYRWKNMIGPRAHRQPYKGHWYDYSTNGWGIVDFMNLCEAAGFLGIPCFSVDETPQDMADFIEYTNGPSNSLWGKKRAVDEHESPYGLRCLQIGNEESVNEEYWTRFEPIARRLWSMDPNLILVVGDFMFDEAIVNPFDFKGSPAGITSLATHQKILQLAKEFDAEVWFDTHIWTEGPNPSPSMNVFFSYVDAIERLAEGAKHSVVVFEFNANNHRQKRALANAEMLGRILRDGRVPVALSANCLQPDGQNDNGWDQGLLFLNSSSVWLQPPGFVTQMLTQAFQPWVLETKVQGAAASLDIVATGMDDNSPVSVLIVNRSPQPREITLKINGAPFQKQTADLISLAGPLEAHNTAGLPEQVIPQRTVLRHALPLEAMTIEVEPYSFTTVRFE